MNRLEKSNFQPIVFILDLLKTIAIFIIATLLAFLLIKASFISDNIFGLYMLSVALVSILTQGYFWGILSSIAGVVSINYFFTYPYFAINFTMAGYPITFAILLLMSIISSAMTAKVKKEAQLSALREKRTDSINNMIKHLLSAQSIDEILNIGADHFYSANQSSVFLCLGDPIKPQKIIFRCKNERDEGIFTSMLERQIAHKAFNSNQAYGAATEEGQHNCLGTYFPIMGNQVTYGVIGILFPHSKWITTEMLTFISFMTSQLFLAIERQNILSESQEILLEKEKEKMRSNLLRAVSHDLRTPLTCILGASATLQDNKDLIYSENGDKLLNDIQSDAGWLIHMVENLLSVTRISDHTAKVKKQEELVEEVVAEAISRVYSRFPQAKIQVAVPEELLIVPMDATLIEQVLINLLENAIHHSGDTKPLLVSVSKDKKNAYFSVRDHGKGIPPEKLANIFDGKSTQEISDSSRGLGIGLTICKSIILAHDGEINAQNNSEGGSTFTFSLPLKGVNQHDQ